MASEDAATEAQIKHLYAVLHSLGIDPKQWKKEQNIASFARLSRGQCSTYIEDLEQLEKEKKAEAEAQEPKAQAEEEPEKQTQAEQNRIKEYVTLLAEITEAVDAEERISEQERGYAINMVFNAITRDRRSELIAELRNGGDREEEQT